MLEIINTVSEIKSVSDRLIKRRHGWSKTLLMWGFLSRNLKKAKKKIKTQEGIT